MFQSFILYLGAVQQPKSFINIGNKEYPLVGIHGERIGELENRKIILYDSSLKYAVDEELNLFKIYY